MLLLFGALAGLGLVVLALPSCQSEAPTLPVPGHGVSAGLALAQIKGEPTVRVRIKRHLRRVRIDTHGKVTIRSIPGTEGPRLHMQIPAPLRIDRLGPQDSLRIITASGTTKGQLPSSIELVPKRSGRLRVNGAPYPGHMVICARTDTKTFDLINHVLMEQYLSGVLQQELYHHWQPQMFMAQAIAARSFALAELARHHNRRFDLESTEASQVYAGEATHERSIDAVIRTRGGVLAYRGQVVPGYYSSCAGGTGQDAAAAFPNGLDIPPLRGRYHGGWGSASAYYRWGPINRHRVTLSRRIAAWGRRMQHSVASLDRFASITIEKRNAVNRPTVFLITDEKKQHFRLGPEAFRFACNYEGGSLPDVPDGAQLPSSHVNVRVVGDQVHFTGGHGFGHGVGLCQYGAQAMAAMGYDAPNILAFYYPGTAIRQAY